MFKSFGNSRSAILAALLAALVVLPSNVHAEEAAKQAAPEGETKPASSGGFTKAQEEQAQREFEAAKQKAIDDNLKEYMKSKEYEKAFNDTLNLGIQKRTEKRIAFLVPPSIAHVMFRPMINYVIDTKGQNAIAFGGALDIWFVPFLGISASAQAMFELLPDQLVGRPKINHGLFDFDFRFSYDGWFQAGAGPTVLVSPYVYTKGGANSTEYGASYGAHVGACARFKGYCVGAQIYLVGLNYADIAGTRLSNVQAMFTLGGAAAPLVALAPFGN